MEKFSISRKFLEVKSDSEIGRTMNCNDSFSAAIEVAHIIPIAQKS